MKAHGILTSAGGHGGPVNVYAAVPSLHVGWAVWAAVAVIRAEPRWRYRHLLWLYPLTTTLVAVATANHFVVHAVAGLMTIGSAVSPSASPAPGLRPRAWMPRSS